MHYPMTSSLEAKLQTNVSRRFVCQKAFGVHVLTQKKIYESMKTRHANAVNISTTESSMGFQHQQRCWPVHAFSKISIMSSSFSFFAPSKRLQTSSWLACAYNLTSMAFSKERCPDDKDLQLAILISQGCRKPCSHAAELSLDPPPPPLGVSPNTELPCCRRVVSIEPLPTLARTLDLKYKPVAGKQLFWQTCYFDRAAG